MNDSKNDKEWIKLFEKHKILENLATNRQYIINASDINEFRQARLMTKFDHKSQLPKIFSDNNLSILPISRGSYVISNFETFHKFEKDNVAPIRVEFPNYVESLDYKNISSESTAINCAFITKMFMDFVQEEELLSTVSGRMSSSIFDFNINSQDGEMKVNVNKAQIEIDGGYEGLSALFLIEAKNYISNDFIIRQLFYPYKLWASKVKKIVKPLFLTYTNGIFHIREYTFEDPNHYNSIKLIGQKKYSISEGAINTEVIEKILDKTQIVAEPQIPFPQADSFARVINLCELLHSKSELTKEDLISDYDFAQKETIDKRQVNYYTDAARYLGLVDKKRENGQINYFLTDKGNNLFKMNIFERQKEFAKLILSHQVFNKTLKLYFTKLEVPTKSEVVAIMKSSNLYGIDSESTFNRRSSTIISWVNWIIDLIEE